MKYVTIDSGWSTRTRCGSEREKILLIMAQTGMNKASETTRGLAKAISNTIKTIKAGGDNLLSATIITPAGELNILAEVIIKGQQLHLDSFTVYATGGGIKKGSILKDIFSTKSNLIQAAVENGFTEIRIVGERVENSSSANPGHVVDLIIRER